MPDSAHPHPRPSPEGRGETRGAHGLSPICTELNRNRTLAFRRGDGLRIISTWAVASFCLNLAWEIAQLPFYTIPSVRSTPQIAYAVAHCTAGDVAIAVVSFLIAAVALGAANWPASHPWRGGAITIFSGVSYTAYAEWYNVYQAGYWAYSSSMPLLFGIGFSPLLQWILLPAVTVLIVRNWAATRQAVNWLRS